jgi:hypothetical protein
MNTAAFNVTVHAADISPAERLRAAIASLTTPYTLQINDPDFNIEQFTDGFDFTGVREWRREGMRTPAGTTLVWLFTWNEVYAVTAAHANPALQPKLDRRQKETLAAAVEILQTVTDESMDDYAKEKAIHDYLCRYVTYDKITTDTRDDSDITPFTAYGALVGGKAVCQGYVNAAAILLTLCGIENYMVESDIHTWNLVKLGEGFYHMDTTWDSFETERIGEVQYSYFNLTDTQMTRYKEHRFKNRAEFPPANATEYHYYFVENKIAESLDDIRRMAEDACASGDSTVTVWVANHSTHNYNWKTDLNFVTELSRNGRMVTDFSFITPGADRDTLTIIFQ